MEALATMFSWGSPLGLGLFLFFSGAGAGIFFWGASHGQKNKPGDDR